MKVVDCTGDILLFYVTLISRLLPTYITAAFIKKLARMALTAPPSAALLVIEFIINLLIRHNTCRFLIHRDCQSVELQKARCGKLKLVYFMIMTLHKFSSK